MQIKSRRMRWTEHVACMREEGKVYKIVVGRPQGKSTLGKSRRKQEDGIKICFMDIGWEVVKLNQVA
jgi:ribosome biogenesis protein Tsr3